MKISPYLVFNGECREAMNFYKSCLGGDLHFMVVSETPMAGQMPPEAQDQIMHSTLTIGENVLMASDMRMGDHQVEANVVIDCASEEEVRRVYDALSAGGNVKQPLGDAFWGGLFGMVQDKYGIDWMLNYMKPS